MRHNRPPDFYVHPSPSKAIPAYLFSTTEQPGILIAFDDPKKNHFLINANTLKLRLYGKPPFGGDSDIPITSAEPPTEIWNLLTAETEP